MDYRFSLVLTCVPLLTASLAVGQDKVAVTKQGTCITCHGEQGQQFLASIHVAAAVRCTDCHGGDDTVLGKGACVENPSFLGVPKGKAISDRCGSCHSDIDRMRQYGLPTGQLELFKTSPHGKRLYEHDDPNAPSCVTCHGTHEILSVHDPRSPVYPSRVPETCASCHADPEKMAPYGHPTTVYEDYQASVHGQGLMQEGTLNLPNCGDCHGTHGARPAGVKEVVNICGNCHVASRDYFRQSPHFAAAEAGEMEECTGCHSHHRVLPAATLVEGNGREVLCGQCHDPKSSDDAGMKAARALQAMEADLAARIADTAAELAHAKERGVIAIEEEDFLNEARNHLIMARPASHSVSTAVMKEVVEKGRGALERAHDSVNVKERQLRDRRIVTTLFFLILLGFLLMLYVKLRKIQQDMGK